LNKKKNLWGPKLEKKIKKLRVTFYYYFFL
jgi:hypothetical protein